MFSNATAFDRDLSKWNVGNVSSNNRFDAQWSGQRSDELNGDYALVNDGEPIWSGETPEASYEDYAYSVIEGSSQADAPG